MSDGSDAFKRHDGRPTILERWGGTGVKTDRVVAWALLLAGALLLLSVAFMSTVPLSGDELTYAARADVLADYLLGRGNTLPDVVRRVVGPGWFMPGVSLALTPLHLVVAEPGPLAVRLYMMVFVVGLWVWAQREMTLAFGRRAGVAFVVFPTLAAMWLVFVPTAWGDLPAGLCLVVVASRVHRAARCLLNGLRLRVRDLLVAELAMVTMVYLRGNAITVVVAVHGLLLGLAIISGRWPQLPRRLGVVAAGGALFAAGLAPWSLAASSHLGGAVITTSSAPMALAVTFGDPDELCFGPCPPQGVWAGELAFSREYARQQGISELEAQQRMAANALRNVTFSEYAGQVRENVGAFVRPAGPGPRRGPPFMRRFAAISSLDLSPAAVTTTVTTVSLLTLLLYVPFFVALLAANLAILRSRPHLQVLSLLVKALTISLFLQPFVHQSHARYWVAYAPVMTLSAILVARWWGARSAPEVAGAGLASWSVPALTSLQGAYVAFIVAVSAAISLG